MKKFLPYIVILVILSGLFTFVSDIYASQANPQEHCNSDIAPTNSPCIQAYHFLAPLPDPNHPGNDLNSSTFYPGDKNALSTYLNLMIKVLIGLCGCGCVVKIAVGGIEYMTSDLPGNKAHGKDIGVGGLLGLGLALFCWPLLNQINPDFFNADLSSLQVVKRDVTITIISGAELTNDVANRNALRERGVTAYADACTPGAVVTHCVNLNGLQPAALTGLEALAGATCPAGGCVIITGGTESGHSTNSTHNDGTGVDLRPNAKINSFITNNQVPQTCTAYNKGNGRYLWEPAGSTCGGDVQSSSDHWHVTYH